MTFKLKLLAAAAVLAIAPLAGCATTTPSSAVAAATEAREPVVWNLTDLYATPEAWQTEYDAVTAELAGIAEYQGRLASSAATLADAYDEVSAINKRAIQLYVYATLKADEDTRIAENQARMQLAEQMQTSLSEATAWMAPELLESTSRVEGFLGREPRLENHAFAIREVLRGAPHTLTADEEALLSAVSLPLGGAERVYNQLANSDIDWPTLEIDGEEVLLNSQGYSFHRSNPDRDVRKAVFDAVWAAWGGYASSMGETLSTTVQGHVFNAKARDFEDARSAALFNDALPTEIYDTLVAEAHNGLPTLHRYFGLRARMLGVDDLAYYDIYPDLVTLPERSYSIEESKAITLEALAPFGEEYLDALRQGFAGDWMHAYPSEGKRSGAYMFGSAYDVHPYVLLNHFDDYDSLSTFAHEWGHAAHSVLANSTQPFETADYATFVAEMASTINEVLLMRRMYAAATTDDERLFYLDKELELYRGTFFRQTMFAEFEQRIHEMAEAGEPATGEAYTEAYLELLKTYHGHDQGVMTIDDAYGAEWAYIPHFYYNFYVFQYATSVTASAAFVERLTSGDATAQEDVIAMLKKGGSEYPHDMFVAAGVDLTTPEPYRALIARMNVIMDEIEVILDRRGS